MISGVNGRNATLASRRLRNSGENRRLIASPSSSSARPRPLARVIQENIKKPLADDILFGKLTRGGHVKVILKDGKLAFDIESAKTGDTAPEAESDDQEPALAE